MYYVNIKYHDAPDGIETTLQCATEDDAIAFMAKCREYDNVKEVKLLKPNK